MDPGAPSSGVLDAWPATKVVTSNSAMADDLPDKLQPVVAHDDAYKEVQLVLDEILDRVLRDGTRGGGARTLSPAANHAPQQAWPPAEPADHHLSGLHQDAVNAGSSPSPFTGPDTPFGNSFAAAAAALDAAPYSSSVSSSTTITPPSNDETGHSYSNAPSSQQQRGTPKPKPYIPFAQRELYMKKPISMARSSWDTNSFSSPKPVPGGNLGMRTLARPVIPPPPPPRNVAALRRTADSHGVASPTTSGPPVFRMTSSPHMEHPKTLPFNPTAVHARVGVHSVHPLHTVHPVHPGTGSIKVPLLPAYEQRHTNLSTKSVGSCYTSTAPGTADQRQGGASFSVGCDPKGAPLPQRTAGFSPLLSTAGGRIHTHSIAPVPAGARTPAMLAAAAAAYDAAEAANAKAAADGCTGAEAVAGALAAIGGHTLFGDAADAAGIVTPMSASAPASVGLDGFRSQPKLPQSPVMIAPKRAAALLRRSQNAVYQGGDGGGDGDRASCGGGRSSVGSFTGHAGCSFSSTTGGGGFGSDYGMDTGGGGDPGCISEDGEHAVQMDGVEAPPRVHLEALPEVLSAPCAADVSVHAAVVDAEKLPAAGAVVQGAGNGVLRRDSAQVSPTEDDVMATEVNRDSAEVKVQCRGGCADICVNGVNTAGADVDVKGAGEQVDELGQGGAAAVEQQPKCCAVCVVM